MDQNRFQCTVFISVLYARLVQSYYTWYMARDHTLCKTNSLIQFSQNLVKNLESEKSSDVKLTSFEKSPGFALQCLKVPRREY